MSNLMLSDGITSWAARYGLVGIGGELTPRSLMRAYRRGVFPWFDDESPLCWWSPDPRAIFEIDTFRPARRLARTYRTARFQLTLDQDFAGVIDGCSDRPGEGTWITPAMKHAYQQLHALGHAHSVEAWHNGELAGGIYGVALGGLFAGESMFHRRTDASKVALVYLMERLRQRGYVLFDTQFLTEHTARLGAIEIPRRTYLRRLRAALKRKVTFAD